MTTQKRKNLGFNGEWVEAFGVGKHVGLTADGQRVELDVTPDFINAIAKNYDVALHEAPATIGHPKDDKPAFGWISGTRVKGDKLELQFADTQPEFEQMVRAGLFKKRSLRLYVDPDEAPGGVAPNIRHCAFLGAEPPAIKNLKNMQMHFSDDEGESIALDVEGDIHFSEGETAVTDEQKKALQEETKKGVLEFLKEKLGFGQDEKPTGVAFSEGDRQKLLDDAVAAAELKFSEELKTRDAKIQELTTQVNSQGGSTKRAAILQFCESNLATVIPAFKNMGLVEFMETLDETPATKKVTVISFSEKDGVDVEVKTEISQLDFFKTFITSLPPFIQFGETFGGLKLKGDGSQIVDREQEDKLREGMGVSKPEAAAAKS